MIGEVFEDRLYALLAVLVAGVAATFERSLRLIQRVTARLPVAIWARPAIGGLALGVFTVPLIMHVGGKVGTPGHALGILGGGYGAAQVAITGADWLPSGWHGAAFLLFLCGAKLLATSLTIGTGGSAGGFGPSLALGGLFGGAFGRAAAVLLHDPASTRARSPWWGWARSTAASPTFPSAPSSW